MSKNHGKIGVIASNACRLAFRVSSRRIDAFQLKPYMPATARRRHDAMRWRIINARTSSTCVNAAYAKCYFHVPTVSCHGIYVVAQAFRHEGFESVAARRSRSWKRGRLWYSNMRNPSFSDDAVNYLTAYAIETIAVTASLIRRKQVQPLTKSQQTNDDASDDRRRENVGQNSTMRDEPVDGASRGAQAAKYLLAARRGVCRPASSVALTS